MNLIVKCYWFNIEMHRTFTNFGVSKILLQCYRSFFFFFWSKNPGKKLSLFPQKCEVKIINNTIINVSWASTHHIRVISEGSCETEDWSNDDENSALITGINDIF